VEKIQIPSKGGKIGPPAIDPDAKACINCEFVHYNAQVNEFYCWKSPPLPIGAFIHTPNGTQLLQAAARAPTPPDHWCGEFKRKASA
jgi:hypothetical protein